MIGFRTAKHARASANRRTRRLAASSGRCNLDCGIVSDALYFPSRIKRAHKSALTVNDDIDRRADRCTITTIRREQNRSLMHELIESIRHLKLEPSAIPD